MTQPQAIKRREALSDSKQGYIPAVSHRPVGIYQVGQSEPEYLFDFQIEHNCDWEVAMLVAVAEVRFAEWQWTYSGLVHRRRTNQLITAQILMDVLHSGMYRAGTTPSWFGIPVQYVPEFV